MDLFSVIDVMQRVLDPAFQRELAAHRATIAESVEALGGEAGIAQVDHLLKVRARLAQRRLRQLGHDLRTEP